MWAEAQWGQRDSYSLGVATPKYWLPACLQQLGYNRGLGAQTQGRHLWVLGKGAFPADSLRGPDWSKRATQDGHGQGLDMEGRRRMFWPLLSFLASFYLQPANSYSSLSAHLWGFLLG